jgi:uncharacterized protein with HEPN domain
MKDNTLYLGHIKDAIDKIECYISGVAFKDFASNDMMVDAIVRELAIIGEATNNLSDSFRRNHPDIPFRDITDMRNILIHDYAGVNNKVVWDTCKKNLPELKRFVADIFD